MTRAIGYRSLNVNHLTTDPNGRIDGIEVKRVMWAGVQGVGYMEKRALHDGYDASDIFLSRRIVSMAGGLYGVSRALFYDRIQQLTEAFTPTAAFAASPGDKGYLPLDFYVPTSDTATWSTGLIHKMVLARPLRQPNIAYVDDRTGGEDSDALSITWDVDLDCRDPRVYLYTPDDAVVSSTASSGAGNFVNRGNYPSPLQIILVVTAGSSAGTFHFVGGGTDLTVNIPADSAQQLIRVSAFDGIATLEVNNIETLRPDLVTFPVQRQYPVVQPGTSGYTWTLVGADLAAGGVLRFYAAWA